MSRITRPTKTAEEYRAAGREHAKTAAESWERSDTDGFVSQWASGVLRQENELLAELAENGGKAEFVALFDLEGNLVPAKYVKTKFGWAWGILADTNPKSRFVAWFNESSSMKESTRRAHAERKGYRLGTVRVPAGVGYGDSNARGLSGAMSVRPSIFRLDGGFSADAEIVDNGSGERGSED